MQEDNMNLSKRCTQQRFRELGFLSDDDFLVLIVKRKRTPILISKSKVQNFENGHVSGEEMGRILGLSLEGVEELCYGEMTKEEYIQILVDKKILTDI